MFKRSRPSSSFKSAYVTNQDVSRGAALRFSPTGSSRRTGRDISRIGCYAAFGYFKLAVVLEGIYARYLLHLTVGEGFEHEGLAVPSLVARAHQELGADD